MGHDIYANIVHEEEVAYLRRAMWQEDKHVIYELLDATDENCGVSGCGGVKEFDLDDIEEALKKAKAIGAAEDILTFLTNIMIALKNSGADEIQIRFA